MMMFAPESIPLRARSWPVLVLWTAAALALLQTVSLCAWYWPGSLPDTDTSGVWIALADDAAHGDFYRPLTSGLGTGGTRYMPLFFTLHAALIKAGLSALVAGVTLTLASAAAFVGSVCLLLRRFAVPVFISLPVAVLMISTLTFQMLLLTVRGDFLAAALNLAGVAFALSRRETEIRRGVLLIAAALFAAAILTKITTVFGLAAVTLWFASQREWRHASRLLGATLLLTIVGLGLALWASEGRMFGVFRAVASGDTSLVFALQSPWRLLVEMSRDPLFCVLLAAGAFGWRAMPRTSPLPALAGLTLLVTLVIFASPGTGKNHLLDVGAISAIILAFAFTGSSATRARAALAVGVFGLCVAVQWLPGVPSVRSFFEDHQKPEIAAVRSFIVRAGSDALPMFAENPLIPIVAGERPFVADAFNLELLMRRDPVLREAVLGRLREGEFGSVVLDNWPVLFERDVALADNPLLANVWTRLRENPRITPEFYDALQDRYRLVWVRRPYLYFLRKDLPFPPPQP
jgi:hypothetical protein